ncbi:MAG: hypothetical protein IJX76_08785 [Clostridia bacterium]|nr:hypothetical protein [Clostridia bacterium]
MDEHRPVLTVPEQQDERMAFNEAYPDVSWDSVPDAVKENARLKEIPVAAAYCLHLQRREQAKKTAASAYQRAVAESPGVPVGALGERLYSIDEMREMTSKEVKSRYHTLLASLKRGFSKW